MDRVSMDWSMDWSMDMSGFLDGAAFNTESRLQCKFYRDVKNPNQKFPTIIEG